MKINCVIVTYNRLSLLKECISALKNQTYKINKIYIINNNSTDGTSDYLQELIADSQFVIINLPQNIGGAGGFSEGIKRVVLDGCDWAWIMDDDTIPMNNALEELVKGTTVAKNVGYVCSRVVWTDGMIHKMNIPRFDCENKQHLPINYYSNLADVLLIRAASFVSLLINSKAVREVGVRHDAAQRPAGNAGLGQRIFGPVQHTGADGALAAVDDEDTGAAVFAHQRAYALFGAFAEDDPGGGVELEIACHSGIPPCKCCFLSKSIHEIDSKIYTPRAKMSGTKQNPHPPGRKTGGCRLHWKTSDKKPADSRRLQALSRQDAYFFGVIAS